MILRWIDVIKRSNNANPEPDKKIVKSKDDWRKILTPEQFRITRESGTERPHIHDMCSTFEPGKYSCVCCGTLLFDANEKFESGTGWPSFTQPVKENAIAYIADVSMGVKRIETICNSCDAHLGHVFPDGPEPFGLRYCINAEALKKVSSTDSKATFGGGCFWCTEAIFQKVSGVIKVESGYSGGKVVNPTYREVCSEKTGHAEVIEVTYDKSIISYENLLKIHFLTHDPTTLNRQGADVGTQYRSAIFTRNEEEKTIAQKVIDECNKELYDNKIITEIVDLEVFYKAEEYHQNYYQENSEQGYCVAVIGPKLEKLKKLLG